MDLVTLGIANAHASQHGPVYMMMFAAHDILGIARQMVRDWQDVSGSSCVKDGRGIIVTESDGVKEVWESTWRS